MTPKQYAKLRETVSVGPIPKGLLFEIVWQDGTPFLYSMKDTVGEWYPSSGVSTEHKAGFVQVYDGKVIQRIDADYVAILTPSNRATRKRENK